jgi:hypothetical protein
VRLLLYIVLSGGVLALPFVLTAREALRLRQRAPADIDHLYVRIERYFGLAFRAKVRTWLDVGTEGELPQGEDRVFRTPEGEPVHVTAGTLCLPDRSVVTDAIVVDELIAGRRCRFHREAYVRGRCVIGAESTVQAVAADGPLVLEQGTRVIRWVDGAQDADIGAGCDVRGKVTAGGTVTLRAGASVHAVHAPTVRTAGARPHRLARRSHRPRPAVLSADAVEAWRRAGADPRRLRALSEDCMEYRGALTLSCSVMLMPSLIVRGPFTAPEFSEFRGALKAEGPIRIGAGSQCCGHVVSDTSISLGEATTFRGVLYSPGGIRIGRGSVGRGDNGTQVAVHAGGFTHLEPDVVIHGKASAGAAVVVEG